jgi:hypothetical protein
MWLDACSLILKNDQWRAIRYQPQLSEEQLLVNTPLESVSGYLDRWIKSLEFGFGQDHCRIIVTPKKLSAGVGCRMIGTILHQLAKRRRDRDQVPRKLFFQAGESHFTLRGLVTLSFLCTAERREDIYHNFSCHCIPARDNETAPYYEKRVVDAMYLQFPGYERLHANELKVGRIQSMPDGLFLSRAKRELIIIEAKKSKRDFADGTAQIVQYYAQARNHPRFQEMKLRTALVTASDQCTEAYGLWEQLMTSSTELKILVDSSSAKGVVGYGLGS